MQMYIQPNPQNTKTRIKLCESDNIIAQKHKKPALTNTVNIDTITGEISLYKELSLRLPPLVRARAEPSRARYN